MDPDVTTSIIKKLEAVFAKDAPLTIQRGKELDYLGMDLDFGEKGESRHRHSKEHQGNATRHAGGHERVGKHAGRYSPI